MNGLFYTKSPLDYWQWENEFWKKEWYQNSHEYFLWNEYVMDGIFMIQEQFLQQYDYN